MTEKIIYSKRICGLFTGLIETWKDIEGYEGHYQVSSFGNVKSMARFRKTKNNSLAPLREKIMKQKTTKYGYKTVHLRTVDKSSHPSVHRLVANCFIKNNEQKQTVNHIDSDKQNNHVNNLEWSTHKEQMIHAVENNLLEVRGAPKYTKQFKKEVLEYFIKNKTSISKLALKFNLSERTAGRIVNAGVNPRKTVRVLKNGERFQEDILTKDQVEEIKRLRSEGWTFIRLSQKFNRGLSHMHRVVNGLTRTTEIE